MKVLIKSIAPAAIGAIACHAANAQSVGVAIANSRGGATIEDSDGNIQGYLLKTDSFGGRDYRGIPQAYLIAPKPGSATDGFDVIYHVCSTDKPEHCREIVIATAPKTFKCAEIATANVAAWTGEHPEWSWAGQECRRAARGE